MKALTPCTFFSVFISLQVVNTAPIISSEALSSRDADIVGSEIHSFTWTPKAARNIVTNELQPQKSKSGKKRKGGSLASSNPNDSNTSSPSGTDTSGGGGGLGPGGQDSG